MGEDKKNKVITDLFAEFDQAKKEAKEAKKAVKMPEPYIEVPTKKERLEYKALAVKAKVRDTAKQAKRKRLEKQHAGVETFDQMFWRWLKSIGLVSTFYRLRTNRTLKPYKQAEKEEKDGVMSTFDWRTRLWIYVVVGGVGIFLLMSALKNLSTVLPALFVVWYVKTHITFALNAKLFDYFWLYKVKKQDTRWQKLPLNVIYYKMPLYTVNRDNQLEDYLEQRGRKGMDSGQKEFASITKSSVAFDDTYGWVRIFSISNKWFRKPVASMEEPELTDYFLIPQRSTSNTLTSKVYYQVHGEVHQSIAGLVGEIDRSEFIDQIAQDDAINFAFPEIAEKLEAIKAEQEAQAQQEAQAKELQALNEMITSKGLSQEVASILMKIRSKADVWNYNIWNGNDNISGNGSYFKVRCILRNGKALKDIRAIQPAIESELRHTIVLNERQDKRAFDLTVILESQLKPFSMRCQDLIEYNKQKKIYIGRSYTGELLTEWNYQANHFVIAGKSGSGKSEAIRELLLQLSHLDEDGSDFDYTTMFLTSSSKIGDFADFGKNGALVASGIDKQIQVFGYILKMLEDREAQFYKESVQNIKDYNQKYPDNRMKQIVLLADEYENTRGDLDKKKAQEAESLMVSILNIARSSGCIVLIGAQSILKQDIGTIKDKMTIRFSGKNEKNVLNTVDPSIASYYSSYRGKPQGVFFYQSDNLAINGDYITQGETSFTLVQTPYITDISTKTLPQLHGSEFEDEIFGNNSVVASEPMEEVEGEDLLI
ncbi:FtsK/SpoIIIE domain-containing protein [Enterococcus sp. AD013-P3]|uniref:FtsK/SpoIIIE domain-containing protein n=1 Tax=Enterococcus sp. AD013-P3 TaxID=3411036 RepID=UPI003B924981